MVGAVMVSAGHCTRGMIPAVKAAEALSSAAPASWLTCPPHVPHTQHKQRQGYHTEAAGEQQAAAASEACWCCSVGAGRALESAAAPTAVFHAPSVSYQQAALLAQRCSFLCWRCRGLGGGGNWWWRCMRIKCTAVRVDVRAMCYLLQKRTARVWVVKESGHFFAAAAAKCTLTHSHTHTHTGFNHSLYRGYPYAQTLPTKQASFLAQQLLGWAAAVGAGLAATGGALKPLSRVFCPLAGAMRFTPPLQHRHS